jgi:hypothetical protein
MPLNKDMIKFEIMALACIFCLYLRAHVDLES